MSKPYDTTDPAKMSDAQLLSAAVEMKRRIDLVTAGAYGTPSGEDGLDAAQNLDEYKGRLESLGREIARRSTMSQYNNIFGTVWPVTKEETDVDEEDLFGEGPAVGGEGGEITTTKPNTASNNNNSSNGGGQGSSAAGDTTGRLQRALYTAAVAKMADIMGRPPEVAHELVKALKIAVNVPQADADEAANSGRVWGRR